MSRLVKGLLLSGIVIYLAVPMIAVLLYSFSGRWTSHMLPDYYTLEHWRNALTDQRLLMALWRSTWMGFAVLILDLLIVVPAVYWQRVRNPRIRTFTELSAGLRWVDEVVAEASPRGEHR